MIDDGNNGYSANSRFKYVHWSPLQCVNFTLYTVEDIFMEMTMSGKTEDCRRKVQQRMVQCSAVQCSAVQQRMGEKV
jgi:hypothetical protein